MNPRIGLPLPRRAVRPARYLLVRLVLVMTLLVSAMAGAVLAGRPQAAGAQSLALATAEAAPADTVLYATLNADPASDQRAIAQEMAQAVGVPEILGFLDVNLEDSGQFGEILEAAEGGEIAITISGALNATDLVETVAPEANAVPGLATPTATADTDAAGAETPPVVIIIIRAVNPDDAYEAVRNVVEQSADFIGDDVTVSDYNGTTIESVVVSGMSADAEGEDVPSSFAVARVEDFVLVAELAEHLYPAIDAASGEADSLADQQAFQDVRAQLQGDYIAYGYANGPRLADSLDGPASAEGETTTGEAPAAYADVLEGDTGLRIWADETAPGFRFDTITVAAEGADRQPAEAGFDTTLDSRVPGTTLLYIGGNDFGRSFVATLLVGLVADLATSMMESGGMATPAVSSMAGMMTNGGASALLQLFSGEYAVALSVPGTAALMDPSQVFFLVTTGVSNDVAAASAVAALDQVIRGSATDATTFDILEIGDSVVYQASNEELGLPIVVQYGVVNGQLLIGFGDTVSTYLAGVESPLSENPQYIQTFDELSAPGDAGGRIYVDLAQLGSLIQGFGTLFTDSSSGITDASPECGAYASQAEAQAAYEEDPFTLLDLDQDFDGEACEDYFATAAEGTPTPTLGMLDLSGFVSYGQIQYEDDGVRGTSGLLLLDLD